MASSLITAKCEAKIENEVSSAKSGPKRTTKRRSGPSCVSVRSGPFSYVLAWGPGPTPGALSDHKRPKAKAAGI
jgi:hypothetical protein